MSGIHESTNLEPVLQVGEELGTMWDEVLAPRTLQSTLISPILSGTPSTTNRVLSDPKVGADLGTTWSEVLAPGDVATYGALCSLASFSRPEMKIRLVDNIAFREFLELAPEV